MPSCPSLNMFTYQMSDIVAGEVQRGCDIDGETVEYAFDLNEFFATKTDSRDPSRLFTTTDVNRFLDALTTQKKFPFSTPEMRNELRHTFWMLNRVDSAKALANKLNTHPLFKDYEDRARRRRRQTRATRTSRSRRSTGSARQSPTTIRPSPSPSAN